MHRKPFPWDKKDAQAANTARASKNTNYKLD